MIKNIGFVGTRFQGTDGVSLESNKWADVLERDDYNLFWFAGKLDKDPDCSMCIPEAYFGHSEVEWINARIWGYKNRSRIVTRRIHDLADYIKSRIYDFVKFYNLDLLIIENALAIPMHVPLGVALTEYMSESQTPVIAHHHDFYWERTRFEINCVHDFLQMAFPPREVSMQHVVINQAGQETLAWRKGVPSILVPNVLDFETPAPGIDEYNADVRKEIGLSDDDIMLLQPTRVVPRKGIEHAIELVEMLNDHRYKLVISHEAGDEGYEYKALLEEIASDAGIDIHFVSTRVGERRQLNSKGEKIYTLWDLYPHADLVTYPSLYEGFGNAFLESIYFRKPLLVNRYSIYARDIEPKGFKVAMMDGLITPKVINHVKRILNDEEYRNDMVEVNYQLAKKFYSYSVLDRKLNSLMANIEGT
ncbi:MAG TPA: glycosyltransferase family 4 protein [Balneolales bacterium]|nr:glycosyltransferase family 4 protein [Balneolales bacterium]